MDDLLSQMMARRNRLIELSQQAQDIAREIELEATFDAPVDNPPIDALTENLAYHWRRYERQVVIPKRSALKPEASVLRSIKLWCRKLVGIDIKRVSVGRMLSAQGFVMNFGGVKGESDLILTPHAGQPFDRQIHVEVKRPEVMIGGKIAQRAGKQSEDQKAYQERMEARGDKYVVVSSVWDLREYLRSLGFQSLPPCKRPKE